MRLPGIIALVFWCANLVQAQITTLQNNAIVPSLFGATEDERIYRIDVPSGRAQLSVKISGGSGDCDLYIRRGAVPTRTTYDQRSINAGNTDQIIVTSPATDTWYILLYGYETYFGVTLEVSHSGTSTPVVTPGNKVWEFGAGGEVYSSPSIGADGTIYFGTVGYTQPSYLYALSQAGTWTWRLNMGSQDIYAGPAIGSDGTVYVVAASRANAKLGKLYAFSPTLQLQWTLAETVHGKHPVALARDGTLYVPAADNRLLAITSAGALKWAFTVESGFAASTPPVIGADGTVYVGFFDSARSLGRLYALRSDGTEKWTYNVSYRIDTPALDADGNVVFGVAHPVNRVYVIRPDGSKKWDVVVPGGSFFSECFVYSPPVIGTDGTIYISSNRRLTALNPTNGSKKWHHDSNLLLTEFDTANGPAIDNQGNIYYGSLGSFGGQLYTLRPNGSLAWAAYATGEVSSQPVITADGKVIFGTSDSRKLFAIQGAGPSADSVWPLARRNVTHTASLEAEPATPPTLRITRNGNSVVCAWPLTATSFGLESTSSLVAPNWSLVSTTPATVGTEFTVTISITSGAKFYRLRKP